MAKEKETVGFGVPREGDYGYAQAVRRGDTIYVSGQLSHEEDGNFVASRAPSW